MILTGLFLSTALFLGVAQGQKKQAKCSFSVWEDQTIVRDGEFGANFGKLAEIYGTNNVDECAFQCTLYRYCYTALYKRYRSSKSCTLYYYHFPPQYMYEIRSPLRITKRVAGQDDETGIIFNTDKCEEMVSALYKTPCQFKVQEEHKYTGYAGSRDRLDTHKVVNAEACAISCGQSSRCEAAVFITAVPQVHSIDTLSICDHHTSYELAQVEAWSYTRVHGDNAPAIVLHDMLCLKASSFRCTYSNSTLMYKSSRTRPDTHNGAATVEECAFVCGHHPLCLSAIFELRKKTCYIYRENYNDDHVFEERSGRDRYSIHLTEIKCEGSKRDPDLAYFKPIAGELSKKFWKIGRSSSSSSSAKGKAASAPRSRATLAPPPKGAVKRPPGIRTGSGSSVDASSLSFFPALNTGRK